MQVANNTQQKKVERVQGIQSGEIFVRLHGAVLCEPEGTLHDAHPFLQKLLHLQDNNATAVQRLVQPSESKLTFSRNLRRQVRLRQRAVKERWDTVQEVIKVHDSRNSGAPENYLSPANSASVALDRYLQQFQRLGQVYKQHVMSDIMHLYALLETESRYISAWSKYEEAKCRDQRALTKLLHQFNSFALQLESETSGQVRMWRLPTSDPQRKRCVKAATENIKKRFFSSPTHSLEVLEVYKIENRVLLKCFQGFTASLSKTTPGIKIKGLFCNVPAESVERCIVYGMHTVPTGESGEPRVIDAQGDDLKIFNRSALLQGCEDAPGTNMAFRARSKVSNGTPLHFPRRFSRYSTLEETRTAMAMAKENETPPVKYLGLCRVAMGNTLRVKNNREEWFPEDPNVGALHFTSEEEYLVRYADAVVPEFIVQFRVKTPSSPLPLDFSKEGVVPVSLGTSKPSLASKPFQDFIYSAAFDSCSSIISALTLALPPSDLQHSVFPPNATSIGSSPSAPAPQQHDEEALPRKAGVIPPEAVLENCARQRAQFRDDLHRLERIFWARAHEIWEEEGMRSGVKISYDDQIHSTQHEALTKIQRGELNGLNQTQDELVCQPQTKPRPLSSKRPSSSTCRRR